MSQDRYLFPSRGNRREFFQQIGVAAAGAMAVAPRLGGAEPATTKQPITLGTGHWTYTLDERWGRLPEGMSYGFGVPIVVDSQDRVYVTSRSESPCLAIFSRTGELRKPGVRTLPKRSISIRSKSRRPLTVSTGIKKPMASTCTLPRMSTKRTVMELRVYKTDLNGRILYELGKNVAPSSNSQPFEFTESHRRRRRPERRYLHRRWLWQSTALSI